MSKIAVKCEGLFKHYNLGKIGYQTFQNSMVSFWARMRGRPDPHAPRGHSERYNKEENVFWALRDVSFEINKGDRVAISGPNGAGKSTLLKIVSRITTPSKGYVGINGRVCSLLEVGTGFHPELTGTENIYLNSAILGMSRKETRKKIDQIIEFSGVREFIDTPVKRYSSGMFVRLAFSVAAHFESDILILDEVMSVGDADFQKKSAEKIDQIVSEGNRTIIFVSHNPLLVKRICQYSLQFDGGRLVEDTRKTHRVLSADPIV